MADNLTQQIKQLEELINSAAASVSTDGLSVSFDLDHAKRRLAELRLLNGDTQMVRPRMVRVRLGGAW